MGMFPGPPACTEAAVAGTGPTALEPQPTAGRVRRRFGSDPLPARGREEAGGAIWEARAGHPPSAAAAARSRPPRGQEHRGPQAVSEEPLPAASSSQMPGATPWVSGLRRPMMRPIASPEDRARRRSLSSTRSKTDRGNDEVVNQLLDRIHAMQNAMGAMEDKMIRM